MEKVQFINQLHSIKDELQEYSKNHIDKMTYEQRKLIANLYGNLDRAEKSLDNIKF